MASKIDWKQVKQIIQKNWTKLLIDLQPDDLLDVLYQEQFLSELQRRDISELQLTSEKNRQILDLATKKGVKGYTLFKQCLRKTGHEHLADLLDSTETELRKKQEAIPKKVVVSTRPVATSKSVERRRSGSELNKGNTAARVTNKSDEGGTLYRRQTQDMSQETNNQKESPSSSPTSSGDGDTGRRGILTESDLMTIATADVLGDDWENLTQYLNITSGTKQEIIVNNKDNRVQQIFQVLLVWAHSTDSPVTWQQLENCFSRANTDVKINWRRFNDLKNGRHVDSSQHERMGSEFQGFNNSESDVSQMMESVSLVDTPMGHTRRQGVDASNSFRIDQSQLSGHESAQSNNEVDIVDAKLDTVPTYPNRMNQLPASQADDLVRNMEHNLKSLKNVLNIQPTYLSPLDISLPPSNLPQNVPRSRPAVPLSNEAAPSVEGSDIPDSISDWFSNTTEEKGRMKVLTGEEIKRFKQRCHLPLVPGAFGKIYRSSDPIPGLNMKVVMKHITIEKEGDVEKMRSITNEKLASRTMHFGIVPLLMYRSDGSVEGRRSFYFITPYMENGNLYEAIQNDKKATVSEKKLTLDIRLMILYHIASAIHFLHTPVDKFRGVVCHMDIKTLNIVLDKYYNARLIDFGLAREMAEGDVSAGTALTTIPGTEGYFPTKTFKQYNRFSDYYSFGVVILELLTGIKPVDGTSHLKSYNEFRIKMSLESMWKSEDKKKRHIDAAEELYKLSVRCRNSFKKEDKNIEPINSSKDIVDKIHAQLEYYNKPKWYVGSDEPTKCDFCMLYDAVSHDVLQHDRSCKIKICVSCMRNSYCNPLWCHSCRKEIIPNIGRNWVGMILAGNDTKIETLAKVFTEDGEKIKTVVTSKCPLVMGISKEKLVMVKPACPGEKENMIDKLKVAFEGVKDLLGKTTDETQKTLFFYYSGHYTATKGFQLGHVDECLTLNELQSCLTNTVGSSDNVRMIVILDCCNAPSIPKFKQQQQQNITLIQINCCAPDECFNTDKGGSIFQRLFTQALTGQSLLFKCNDITESRSACVDCKIDGDFVTIEKLLAFIDKHYNACSIIVDKRPSIEVQNAGIHDVRIGYVVNFHIEMSINFEWRDKTHSIPILPRTFYSIDELKTILFDEVLNFLPSAEGPRLSTVIFKDILLIYTTKGPDSSSIRHRNELDTMEKVNMAWESKRQLYVTLRNAANAEDGLVAVFSDGLSDIIDDLLKRKKPKTCDATTIEVTVECQSFLEHVCENYERDLPQLAKVAMDLHSEQHDLNEKGKNVTQLNVKIPYEEGSNPKYRKDFLCFNLVIDNQAGSG